MIAIEVVAIMMLLRIQALYHKQRSIIYGVGFLLLCQTIVNAWLLTKGEPVVHNPNSGVRACSMIFDTKISVLAAASAWMPLLYDTIILGLTLCKTLPAYRSKNMSFIMRRILEDGLIYYTVIFAITLILTFMIIAAPPGVKNITAQTEQLLTVTMMSRITLNLKKAARKLDALVLDVDADGVVHHMPLHMDRSFGTQRWQDLMSFQILHTSAVATDA
ncbi:hypothetical protein FPV67DRAFT_164591 [Lyophyllum atratum]|nr:hypothetical protein FPV67DRAFT_164591 [Lyophyllum atratum]